MKSRNYVLTIISGVIMLTGCSKPEGSKEVEKVSEKTTTNKDSIELAALVRNLYKWHETSYFNVGFPLKADSASHGLFTGIDWNAYNRDYEVFKRTNFFSDDFLARHRAIAMTLDSSIRQASVEWRNPEDGVPVWSTDTDDWCGCQDYPDNYWQRLKINNLKFNGETAAFNWSWGKEEGIDPPFKYEMKAKKINGSWKISYLEGFEHYGTVSDYKKIMSPHKVESRH
ncbi:hypothetical protein [Hymenobacter baengnokdamensis]|uniref:hypothetical protein n=1 Tax=Hymenobacter baengnokdamensis TaxID=2615203 RepID=UPI00124585FD|nr:hypothetical protein [Hymenobacter baengnokdamensis]